MTERTKKRIIFVDDEPNILSGLKRMLHSFRNEWDMVFVDSGFKALEVLENHRCDIIVTDIRMPKMNGVELLIKVKDRYPHMLRIALSGHSSEEVILRSAGPSHQFLAKPCDAEVLRSVIQRSSKLRDILSSDNLKKTIGEIQTLPSLPSLYLEIIEELKSPNSSLKKIGEIISKDLGMTSKILQLVNSAYFGLRKTITNPTHAATVLGIDTIKSLTLSLQIFKDYDQTQLDFMQLSALWNHSITTSLIAKEIMKKEKPGSSEIDDSFMAGLLHDVGVLILASSMPDGYRDVIELAMKDNLDLIMAEKQVLNTTHAEVGAYLLGIWGLPDTIIEAVFYHHTPRECPSLTFGAQTAVYAANVLDSGTAFLKCQEQGEEFDIGYLNSIGVASNIPSWVKIAESVKSSGE